MEVGHGCWIADRTLRVRCADGGPRGAEALWMVRWIWTRRDRSVLREPRLPPRPRVRTGRGAQRGWRRRARHARPPRTGWPGADAVGDDRRRRRRALAQRSLRHEQRDRAAAAVRRRRRCPVPDGAWTIFPGRIVRSGIRLVAWPRLVGARSRRAWSLGDPDGPIACVIGGDSVTSALDTRNDGLYKNRRTRRIKPAFSAGSASSALIVVAIFS